MLQTRSRSFGDAVIVDCEGRIVLGEETAFLRHQMTDVLKESRQIVLNLADVHYVDSTGVGELVSMYTSARNIVGSERPSTRNATADWGPGRAAANPAPQHGGTGEPSCHPRICAATRGRE